VANLEQLKRLVDNVPPYVEKLINIYSPGPLTYVLPASGVSADNVTAGLSTIAVRIPDHETALEIIKASNLPIAAPSANLSGKPSPTTAQHVFEDLSGKIAGIVDAGPAGVGLESTVIACHEEHVVILRPGGVTKEEIEKIIPVYEADNLNTEQPASPGMKYKHYAPEVPLWLVAGDFSRIQAVIQKAQEDGKKVALLASDPVYQQVRADQKINLGTDLSAIAMNLYEGLRACKASEVDLIVAEAFLASGIGAAVMNRLKKAMTKYIQE
jgi:L-threonylcarbamoyladenylate synthase